MRAPSGASTQVELIGQVTLAWRVPASTPGHQAVLEANQRFYEAFEAADFQAMSSLWEHSDRVFCTHPGWATLRGWPKVAASFLALFREPEALQFILTEPRAVVGPDLAWVSLDENILGDEGATTVAAVNLFSRRGDGTWQMVAHHGSPVSASAETGDLDGRDAG